MGFCIAMFKAFFKKKATETAGKQTKTEKERKDTLSFARVTKM